MSQNDTADFIEEQDRFLPIANVARIMKRVVPSSGKLSKESKLCVQECVTEFIQFIVAEASERCANEKRKTITCEDLLQAMNNLGFDSYAEVLDVYIKRYRNSAKNVPSEENNHNIDNNSHQNNLAEFSDGPHASSLQPASCIFQDSTNGQHYIRMEAADGTYSFMPVTLSTTIPQSQ